MYQNGRSFFWKFSDLVALRVLNEVTNNVSQRRKREQKIYHAALLEILVDIK